MFEEATTQDPKLGCSKRGKDGLYLNELHGTDTSWLGKGQSPRDWERYNNGRARLFGSNEFDWRTMSGWIT